MSANTTRSVWTALKATPWLEFGLGADWSGAAAGAVAAQTPLEGAEALRNVLVVVHGVETAQAGGDSETVAVAKRVVYLVTGEHADELQQDIQPDIQPVSGVEGA